MRFVEYKKYYWLMHFYFRIMCSKFYNCYILKKLATFIKSRLLQNIFVAAISVYIFSAHINGVIWKSQQEVLQSIEKSTEVVEYSYTTKTANLYNFHIACEIIRSVDIGDNSSIPIFKYRTDFYTRFVESTYKFNNVALYEGLIESIKLMDLSNNFINFGSNNPYADMGKTRSKLLSFANSIIDAIKFYDNSFRTSTCDNLPIPYYGDY